MKKTFGNSIRIRILSMTTVIFVIVVCIMLYFIIQQLDNVSLHSVKHEGLLLSNILVAGIVNHAGHNDIQAIQNYINRIVDIRNLNDIEINVIFLTGDKSRIVASNNKSNLGSTSDREHNALLKSITNESPHIFVARQVNDSDKTIDGESAKDPSHPDFYFQSNERFISISTVFSSVNSNHGSINVKLSLAPLDRKISMLRNSVIIIVLSCLLIIFFTFNYLLDRHLLHPLKKMSEEIKNIGKYRQAKNISTENMDGELGVLAIEFNQMMNRIKTLINEMTMLINNIAHDLRSPITSIRGTAEVALTTKFSIEEHRNVAALTIEGCDYMLANINTILDYAEIESGAVVIEKKPVDISEIVNMACDLFQSVADQKQINLKRKIPDSCILTGNVSMIQRVVANLLDNALKYTPKSGEVCIKTQCTDNTVTLSFSDNGAGISEDDISHVFERFYRCSPSRNKHGVGLGLSLCRSIIKAHGGDILVDSTINEGSIFTVSIPK